MFKIILAILLLLHLLFLPPFVYAVDVKPCSNLNTGITLTSKPFFVNSDPMLLTFDLTSGGAQYIQGNGPYIRYRTDMFGVDWGSEYIQINSDQTSFQIKIPKTSENGVLFERGEKNGKIEISKTSSDKDFSPYCTDIKFQVGILGGQCLINPSLPTKVQPNALIPIRFLGSENQTYLILVGGKNLVEKKITTDEHGLGEFVDIPIDGNPGEIKEIKVASTDTSSKYNSCGGLITLDVNAPSPLPIPSGSIDPGIITQPKKCGDQGVICTSAVSLSCDPSKPSIKTAIGCIHTEPADLIADVLKFALGIGGGLAFLMMLLGAFQMLTSAGNPETLQAGRERLTSAIIGLLFVIFAVLLLQIIGFDILGIPGFGR
ncbi:hypothetical protein HYZ06_00940 [Candidatus Daviesbacteria bacterium]|nr:hypothetical protein [Candidatus Daviesbacteria bacterium]